MAVNVNLCSRFPEVKEEKERERERHVWNIWYFKANCMSSNCENILFDCCIWLETKLLESSGSGRKEKNTDKRLPLPNVSLWYLCYATALFFLYSLPLVCLMSYLFYSIVCQYLPWANRSTRNKAPLINVFWHFILKLLYWCVLNQITSNMHMQNSGSNWI